MGLRVRAILEAVALFAFVAVANGHSYQAFSCNGPDDTGSPHGVARNNTNPFTLEVTGDRSAGTTARVVLSAPAGRGFIGFLVVTGSGLFTTAPEGTKFIRCAMPAANGVPGSGFPTAPSSQPSQGLAHSNNNLKTSISTTLQLPTSGSVARLKWFVMVSKVNDFYGPMFTDIDYSGGTPVGQPPVVSSPPAPIVAASAPVKTSAAAPLASGQLWTVGASFILAVAAAAALAA